MAPAYLRISRRLALAVTVPALCWLSAPTAPATASPSAASSKATSTASSGTASSTPLGVTVLGDAQTAPLMSALAGSVPGLSVATVNPFDGTFALPGCPTGATATPQTRADGLTMMLGNPYHAFGGVLVPGPDAGCAPAVLSGPEVPAPAAPATTSFPDATSTGVPAGTALTPVNDSVTIDTPGAVVSGLDIQGALIIKADQVTVRDTRVRCVGVNDFCVQLLGAQDLVRDTEIGGGADGATLNNQAIGVWMGAESGPATSGRLLRANVHHLMQGLRVDGSATVQDSYVHDLSYAPGVHSEATYNSSGSNVLFEHNTVVGGNAAVMFIQPDSTTGTVRRVTFNRNRIRSEEVSGQQPSWGIAVTANPDAPNLAVSDVAVTNNVFDAGPWQVAPATQGYSWLAWSGNVSSTGAVLPAP